MKKQSISKEDFIAWLTFFLETENLNPKLQKIKDKLDSVVFTSETKESSSIPKTTTYPVEASVLKDKYKV